MLENTIIQKAKEADLETLINLDQRGFLIGADETAETYSERLECLRKNCQTMEDSLNKSGEYEVEDVKVIKKERIPVKVFKEVASINKEAYDFEIDWVPGFFITPSGLLFAGCAYYFFPDFFTLFIISNAFAKSEKWFIYSRSELISHELCHIARIGLLSQKFEEAFAYDLSESGFRRAIGCLLVYPYDAFLILGSVMALLVATFVKLFALPGTPVWLFWILVGAVFTFMGGRHMRYVSIRKKALRNITAIYGEKAKSALFRCTDDEIITLSKAKDTDEVKALIADWQKDQIRWQVIEARFNPENR